MSQEIRDKKQEYVSHRVNFTIEMSKISIEMIFEED